MKHLRFFERLVKGLFRRYRWYLSGRSLARIKRNSGLWDTIYAYAQRSPYPDRYGYYTKYWTLYNYIRRVKPKEVLECGTGISTVIMAYAMMENDEEIGVSGRITSMEDSQQYYRIACELLPAQLEKYVSMILSPKVEYRYSLFRGVGYRDVPQRPYDFVFVDGPGTGAPSDGMRTFDFDFIHVVARTKQPVYAIVDRRSSTCWVFGLVFGADKVKCDNGRGLGFVGPCVREDLRLIVQGNGG